MAEQKVKVGVVGFGTVGCGVARLILEQADSIAAKTGLRVELACVVDVDTESDRPVKLPEGILTTARLDDPPGALQGKNSWPATGYRGPAPPRGSGRHRYVFKLYALDTELDIEPEMDKTTLLGEMSGHVLGEGRLIGTYER